MSAAGGAADPAATALAAARALLAHLETPPVPAFRAALPSDPPRRRVAPTQIPAVRHLPGCLASSDRSTAPLVRSVATGAAKLAWGRTYGPEDFGTAFHANYGWCELLGTRGHFVCDRVALGLLLLGPGLHYPAHWHVAEEIYVPLTGGAQWRAGETPFTARPAGAVVHHQSNVPHAMRTDETALLALYLWRGGDLAQRSGFATADDFER